MRDETTMQRRRRRHRRLDALERVAEAARAAKRVLRGDVGTDAAKVSTAYNILTRTLAVLDANEETK